MTEAERDDLLLELKKNVEWLADRMEKVEPAVFDIRDQMNVVKQELLNLKEHVGRLDAKVDAVSDGLQDLRRDLESHGMLPPVEVGGQ